MRDYIHIVASASSLSGTSALSAGHYYLATKIGENTKLIGQFAFIPGLALNVLVDVFSARSRYTVHAGPNNDLKDGEIAVYGADGKYSQAATLILLGPDGGVVATNIRKPSPGVSETMTPGASKPGRIAIYDPAGKFSEAATRSLLGIGGSIINVNTRERPGGASGGSSRP